MHDSTFQRFRELILRKGGIALGTGKKDLLSGRIRHRMQTLGLKTPDDYWQVVQEDGYEVVHLLDSIATNHTFFFRESEHFEVLRGFVRERLAAGQRRFRIWCAAASSGEEPYSLAMTLLEIFDEQPVAVDFKLLATDLSTKILAQAQTGWYSQDRCACLPSNLRSKYFESASRGSHRGWRVKQRLRDTILFRHLNLIDFPYPQQGPIDVIFCRNVMIYFEETMRRSIIDHMHRLLPEHGLLFVGLTESILGISDRYAYVSPSVYRASSTHRVSHPAPKLLLPHANVMKGAAT